MFIIISCVFCGEHYDLGVGNYDIADVENMDFYPDYIDVPQGLRGIGITMILTGLISMAYLSLSGINL